MLQVFSSYSNQKAQSLNFSIWYIQAIGWQWGVCQKLGGKCFILWDEWRGRVSSESLSPPWTWVNHKMEVDFYFGDIVILQETWINQYSYIMFYNESKTTVYSQIELESSREKRGSCSFNAVWSYLFQSNSIDDKNHIVPDRFVLQSGTKSSALKGSPAQKQNGAYNICPLS